MIFLFFLNLFSHFLNICKLLASTPSYGDKSHRLTVCCMRKRFLIFSLNPLIHYTAPLTKPVPCHWSDCTPFRHMPKKTKLQENAEFLGSWYKCVLVGFLTGVGKFVLRWSFANRCSWNTQNMLKPLALIWECPHHKVQREIMLSLWQPIDGSFRREHLYSYFCFIALCVFVALQSNKRKIKPSVSQTIN